VPDSEIQTKQQRLGEWLQRHSLDGVLLQRRANFAWITGGRDNHVANNSPVGIAAILATADSRLCLANTIEAPRMKTRSWPARASTWRHSPGGTERPGRRSPATSSEAGASRPISMSWASALPPSRGFRRAALVAHR